VSRQIVPIVEEAWAGLLELNNRHTTETSPLGAEAWARLLEHAFRATMVDDGTGFLIALDQGAPYANPNHGWFRARYDRFVYVDRVVVDPAARRQGLARLLYEDLFAHAREVGHEVVTCEIHAEPPNPASDAMHAALGFREVGGATFPETGKRVRYMALALRDVT
jgi:predicted GNAT superfamily acetyltransferase